MSTAWDADGEVVDERPGGIELPYVTDSTLIDTYGGVSIQAMRRHLEGVIERGLQTFEEVGMALLEIRDKKLYVDRYGSLKEYCRERWGFSDSRGRQLIAAAKLAQHSVTTGNDRPKTEREARAIAREQREAAKPKPAPVIEQVEDGEWEEVKPDPNDPNRFGGAPRTFLRARSVTRLDTMGDLANISAALRLLSDTATDLGRLWGDAHESVTNDPALLEYARGIHDEVNTAFSTVFGSSVDNAIDSILGETP